MNLKIRIMIAGLLLISLFWMTIIINAGFWTAVRLVEPIFYQAIPEHQINVPHHRSGVVGMIEMEFGGHATLAIAVFTAESHLKCDTISSTGDYGVAQINLRAHPQYAIADLLNCKKNIEIAGKIFKQQGNFSAWSAYKNGSYKKYLNYHQGPVISEFIKLSVAGLPRPTIKIMRRSG